MYRATWALLPPSRKSCYITIRFPSPYPFPYSRLPKRRVPPVPRNAFPFPYHSKKFRYHRLRESGIIMDKCASCRCHGTSLRRIGGFFLRKSKYPSQPRILDMVKRLFCTLSRIRDVFWMRNVDASYFVQRLKVERSEACCWTSEWYSQR